MVLYSNGGLCAISHVLDQTFEYLAKTQESKMLPHGRAVRYSNGIWISEHLASNLLQ